MNYHFDSIDLTVLFAIFFLALAARFGGFGRGWWAAAVAAMSNE